MDDAHFPMRDLIALMLMLLILNLFLWGGSLLEDDNEPLDVSMYNSVVLVLPLDASPSTGMDGLPQGL